MFCESETVGLNPACKTCRSHFNWFSVQNLQGKSKIFWACDALQLSIDLKFKINRENQKYIETRVATHVLWARTGGSPSSRRNIQVTFYLIFSTTFTGKIKSILKLAMQVNFQLNFRTKFTGKIKNILKLAMLRIFCRLETGGPTLACKTCRSHFNWFPVQNLVGKLKVYRNSRCRSTFNWILVQNLLRKSKIISRLAMLSMLFEPETGGPTSAGKTCGSHFNWFWVQNLLRKSKYFEHAMQVKFKLIFRTKFSGKF